jgi:hypothetical protein
MELMKLHAAVRLGAAHVTYCEDFLLTAPLCERSLLCAVLDGCSMGQDSHFASALFGKLLRKVARQMSQESLYVPDQVPWEETRPETLAQELLRRLFREVKSARSKFELEWEELLTTVTLWVHHYETQRSFVIVVGDGFVSCDGQVYELDQNNRPDYMSYHMDKDFEAWYPTQEQRFDFAQPRDLCIATDGVNTFRPMQQGAAAAPDLMPLNYLMVDRFHLEAVNMLDQKIDHLEREHRLHPIDDVAMIRILFDREVDA